MMSGLFIRLVDQDREPCRFYVNGTRYAARRGDTVMTALLTLNAHLRLSEFSGMPRAGFCLMGACQDCVVMQENGIRIRACSTLLQEDMRFVIPETA